MWIPVAGPFLTMGNTDSADARVFLGAMGVAQVAGAIHALRLRPHHRETRVRP